MFHKRPLLVFVVNAKNGATCFVEISVQLQVKNLKREVHKKTDIPQTEMVLIHLGEELKEDSTIRDCKLVHNGSITLLDRRDTPEEVVEPGSPAAKA